MNEQMIRKNNMRIFPMYKMFAWDLLFYYAIVFLFLTQVKGFSASQVLLVDSFYAVFRVAFQIFCINITDKIGKQKSLLIGNILISLSILIVILGNNFTLLMLYALIEAIGYCFKSICEPTMLSDSIPQSSSFPKIYSKIDAKGNSAYYVFDAISAVSTGFLYVLNPYIPMIMCLVCCLISTIISLAFSEVPLANESKKETQSIRFKEYYKDMLNTFRQIAKSNRLKSLLIFSLCFYGILSSFNNLRSSILVDINVPEQYFGIILAGMQIISSIAATRVEWFHKKLRNRALTVFSLSIFSFFIITGVLVTCNISFIVSLLSVLLTCILIGIVRGPYYTLINRYLNSFSNPYVNTKIFAINSLLENVGRVVISLIASFLLDITTTSYTFIILGFIFFILFLLLLNYMKTKVGLKPDEYPKEDLIFSDEK